MKSYYLTGLVGLLFFTSCSTNEEPPKADEKVKVSFNVSTFDVDVAPISRATAKDALTKIECQIYNYTNYETTTITRSTSTENFGVITAWLAPGQYQIGIVGIGADGTGDGKGTNAASLSRSNYGTFNASSYDKDAFGYATSFTVGSDSEVNTSITLNRYVGKLCVNLDGDIPNVIKRVEISYSHNLWVSLSDFSSSNITGTKSVSTDLTISDGAVAEYIRYITPGEINVTFTTYDSSDSKISSLTVKTKITANKKTIIKGSATNLLNQIPFEVSVNDEWDSDLIVPLQ